MTLTRWEIDIFITVHTSFQGSICIPNEALSTTNGMGHGVATAMEFYNEDDLLFPSFQYDPQSNLSSIIGFSLDDNSKVELSRDAEPVRIRFKQVTMFTN